MTPGARIKRARKAKKWSLATLEAETGINKSRICRIEADNAMPTHSQWITLSTVLNESLDYLMKGELNERRVPPETLHALDTFQGMTRAQQASVLEIFSIITRIIENK